MRFWPGVRNSLFAWVLAGVILDAALLACFWMLLDAAGPLSQWIEAWLVLIGLVTVPWCVHVVVLPSLFCATARDRLARALLLARSAAFVLVAAVLIPILGIVVAQMLFFCIVIFVVIWGIPQVEPPWVDRAGFAALWAAIVVPVGAAIGLVLHVLRRGNLDERVSAPVHQPSTRSDLLGGTIAGFLAFAGMFVALPLGLFARPMTGFDHGGRPLAVAPQLLTSVIIGTVALLPHLLMTGADTLRSGSLQKAGAA